MYFRDECAVIDYAREIIIEYLGEDVLQMINISVKDLPKHINARVGINRWKETVVEIYLEINIAMTNLEVTDELLRSIIEHEIVHIATEMLSEKNQGHNEKFFAVADGLGIKTNKFRRM